MEMNPASEAHEAHQNEIEKLQAEIERLRRKNRKLDEEHAEMTMRFNDTNLTMNIQEVKTFNQNLHQIFKNNKIYSRQMFLKVKFRHLNQEISI